MMSVRELILHLLMCGELDDPVRIEVKLPEHPGRRYYTYSPMHVTHLGEEARNNETLIDCQLIKGDE